MNQSLNHMESFEEFKDYFESLVAVLPGHVYWKDLNCRFLGCNDAQAKAVRLKNRSEIVGLSAYDVITSNQSEAERTRQADAINQVDQEVMRTGIGVTLEEPLILEDGSERIFLSQKIPLKDKSDQIIGLLGSSIDITDQKIAEDEARDAKNKLEILRLKQSFLDNMRHDIRTPFSGLLSGAQLLAEQEDNPDKKVLLENMADASELLLNYLNEILEFTELDNGYVPLLAKSFNLEDLLNDCYKLFLPSATQKQLEFSKSYGSRLPKWVISDRFRVQRIIINLLSNAIKFTHSGSISIGIDFVEKKENEKGILKIMVKDTGIGIPNDKKNVIFEKFEMITPTYQSKYHGVGLGLVAVRDLVKSLNGNIFVKSTEGEGSAFICVLPFDYPLVSDTHFDGLFDEVKISSAIKPMAQQDVSKQCSNVISFKKSTCKVLLVEDTPMAAKIATKILNEKGCMVDIACNGEQAVKMAQTNTYDFILMDIGLPDFDGVEATKRILKNSKDKPIPIVALTAHISDEVNQNCLKVSISQVLSKPLTSSMADNLLKTLGLQKIGSAS